MPRKPAEAKATCATCIFWNLVEIPGRNFKAHAGECRRYPMIRIAGEDDLEGMWCNPPAPSDYWCGEHTVKPNS